MTNLKRRLGGLLAIQVLLGAGLFWFSQQEQQNPQQPLLSFETKQVDRVVISDGDDNVTLLKSGNRWQLSELEKLPVIDSKLNGLLARLQELQTGWPVATTGSARKRFQVAKDDFQKRIELYRGDNLLGELFVGTSPGFRKVHMRQADDHIIYTGKLNSYELPAESSEWLDKSLLAINDIHGITGADYSLKKTGGDWAFADTSRGQQIGVTTIPELDTKKARQLASALTGLRVQHLASMPKGEDVPDTTEITLKVSEPKGNWTYLFTAADDKYYVSRSDRDTVFSISQFDYERITKTGLPELTLKDSPPAEEETPGDAPKPSQG